MLSGGFWVQTLGHTCDPNKLTSDTYTCVPAIPTQTASPPVKLFQRFQSKQTPTQTSMNSADLIKINSVSTGLCSFEPDANKLRTEAVLKYMSTVLHVTVMEYVNETS